MVDNQHKKISGYRDLDDVEISIMNHIKSKEKDLCMLLDSIDARLAENGDVDALRWLAISRDNLEIGIMFAIKAVARPDNGLGRTGV